MKRTRLIAFEILKSVFIQKKHSNVMLNHEVSNLNNFKMSDRALIFKIVYGTIKNKIYLEYITSKYIDEKRTSKEIKILLWLSLYQQFFLEKIPSYAIVNEAVEIAKQINPKLSGFVNASLKKIINDPHALDINEENEVKRDLIKYSFPEFLYWLIQTQYGEEIARKVMIDSVNIPKISLRVNTLKISLDEVIAKYPQLNLQRSDICKDVVISTVPIVDKEIFKSGEVIIQDEMSAHVVEVLEPQENELILDMCAAPGGKTTYIAQLMKNTGHIDAYDVKEHKVKLIEQNIEKLGIKNTEVYCLDARNLESNKTYDRILLDAPCSGFGVIKRKPEIKYHEWNTNEIISLVKVQAELLEKAYQLLKPAGILVYSTCTFDTFGNQDQIKTFLNKYKDMEILFEKQTFGFENNTDGFYICKMKKSI